jgi:membrane-bound serine protease (ClpP class)
MIDKSKGLVIDGEVLSEKGQILTLTDLQAAKQYGTPPKPLLSSGTVGSLDALLEELGAAGAGRTVIKATGAEQLAMWLNAIRPLLLIIGVIGVYIEFKTPGFGLPGIVGIVAFVLYFLGGYVAGVSGMEWALIFILGLALVAIELFVYPGSVVLGLVGVALILTSLVMAMVDFYPGMPRIPSLEQLLAPVKVLLLTGVGCVIVVALLSRFLPKTPIYRTLVSKSASGVQTEVVQETYRAGLEGKVGVALSVLRPGGKARIGDQIIDVITRGEMIDKGSPIKIVGHSGREAIVEATEVGEPPILDD